MECQYGLLDKLKEYDILSKEQVDEVAKLAMNPGIQNETLLNIIPMKFDVEVKFCTALNETDQGHITHYINKKEDCGDNRHLTEYEVEALDGLQEFFVDELHINNNFLQNLLSSNCISVQHKNAIDKLHKFDKRRLLLDIMHCRSLAQVKKFIELCQEHYPHLRDLINCDGAIFVEKVNRDPKRKENQTYILQNLKEMNHPFLLKIINVIKDTKNVDTED